MTQKQTIGVVVGVLVLGTMFTFVYRQLSTPFAEKQPMSITQQSKTTAMEQAKEIPAPEPATIDDVTLSIQSEMALDLSALDDEANGEISEIETDSESVNNLGTSYDENNL